MVSTSTSLCCCLSTCWYRPMCIFIFCCAPHVFIHTWCIKCNHLAMNLHNISNRFIVNLYSIHIQFQTRSVKNNWRCYNWSPKQLKYCPPKTLLCNTGIDNSSTWVNHTGVDTYTHRSWPSGTFILWRVTYILVKICPKPSLKYKKRPPAQIKDQNFLSTSFPLQLLYP